MTKAKRVGKKPAAKARKAVKPSRKDEAMKAAQEYADVQRSLAKMLRNKLH